MKHFNFIMSLIICILAISLYFAEIFTLFEACAIEFFALITMSVFNIENEIIGID